MASYLPFKIHYPFSNMFNTVISLPHPPHLKRVYWDGSHQSSTGHFILKEHPSVGHAFLTMCAEWTIEQPTDTGCPFFFFCGDVSVALCIHGVGTGFCTGYFILCFLISSWEEWMRLFERVVFIAMLFVTTCLFLCTCVSTQCVTTQH